MEGLPHLRIGRLAISHPRVLSGDSPHYLLAVSSLIEDGDLDLKNNYAQAQAGDWDAGSRFRGRPLDHHVDVDLKGREISFHPPCLAMLLAPVAWPLRGTHWVEAICILSTISVSLAGLWLFARRSGCAPVWVLVLAVATPLWCYSRDLWTEPWLASIWIALLYVRSLPALAALALVGTLIKYPFGVVPVLMGLLALWQGERRRGCCLAISGLLGVVAASAFAQYLFRDTDHFDFFHLGAHFRYSHITTDLVTSLFQLRLEGVAGLLFGSEDGLLPFFPVLALGFWSFRKGGGTYLPALAFFLVHALYAGWQAGTGFSARYLVPMLPALVLGVAEMRAPRWVLRVAVVYGLIWGTVGGVLPAIAYDRSIPGIVQHVWAHRSEVVP
jgi:hypothetical protein